MTIVNSYGDWSRSMETFGLKAFDPDDEHEALGILESFVDVSQDQEGT